MDTAQYFFSVRHSNDEAMQALVEIYRTQTQLVQGLGTVLQQERSPWSPGEHPGNSSIGIMGIAGAQDATEQVFVRNKTNSVDLTTSKILVDNLPERDKNRSALEEVMQLVAQEKIGAENLEKILYPADDLSRDDVSDAAQKIRSDVVREFPLIPPPAPICTFPRSPTQQMLFRLYIPRKVFSAALKRFNMTVVL